MDLLNIICLCITLLAVIFAVRVMLSSQANLKQISAGHVNKPIRVKVFFVEGKEDLVYIFIPMNTNTVVVPRISFEQLFPGITLPTMVGDSIFVNISSAIFE